MKKSKYNIFVKCKGFTICYNSFTNRYIGLSPRKADLFENCIDLLEYRLNYPQHYDALVNAGFIIDESVDELNILRLRNKESSFNSRDLLVMVYPTQDCNLKCWYCYESHVKDSIMKPDVMSRIKKMIAGRAERNEFDEIRLAFFGGEPLIDFENIAYPLAKNIKSIVLSYKKRFRSFFVTNGSLISTNMISRFKEISPIFQITLDGNRQKHNTVRIWKKDGAPTYDTIIKAIKQITSDIYNEGEYPMPIITLRINYDNNTLKNISELLEDLGGINRKSINIHFERVWQTKRLVDEEQRELLWTALRTFMQAGFHVAQGCFGIKDVSCPAETNNYVIVNYDGLLYRCNGRTLSPESKEGILLDNGDTVWDENIKSIRMGLATFENSRCLKCVMLPQCMGPCSQKLIEHGGINDSICTLSTLDVPLEEYLRLDFEMKCWQRSHIERITTC